MALNVKQKYPGTQGGAAQLYASDTCHSEEESKYLRGCQNHTKKTWIFQAPVAPAPAAPAIKKLLFCSTFILPCIFFVFLFLPGSVDATWRISSSSLRMCAWQDCFVFERPQVVFYCNFSCSRLVSKSGNLIGRIVFDAARQTKKTNPRRFKKKMTLLRVGFFAREIRPGVYGSL